MSDVLLLTRAAVSWLAAVTTVAAAMLLRADSDGVAPTWPVFDGLRKITSSCPNCDCPAAA